MLNTSKTQVHMTRRHTLLGKKTLYSMLVTHNSGSCSPVNNGRAQAQYIERKGYLSSGRDM
jgi:hypothetical protein